MNIDLSPEFCNIPCRVLMNKIPPTAVATEKLVDLTKRLLSIDYKAVVVYEDNYPIGLITLKDIMRWLVQADDKESIQAKDLVTVPLISVDIDAPLPRKFPCRRESGWPEMRAGRPAPALRVFYRQR